MTGSLPALRILALSGYHATSHGVWLNELELALAGHQLSSLTLPPRHFAWRLRGGPLSWHGHERLRERYDLVIATSMVDLATLKGLNPALAAVPTILYFHENQFCYPTSNEQSAALSTRVDRQMVQLYSALAADAVAFNSAFNRNTFLNGVRQLTARLPDHIDRSLAEDLSAKATVLPIPIVGIGEMTKAAAKRSCIKLPFKIVWNHRVEYDKGVAEFYAALKELTDVDFQLILLGQRFRRVPAAWQQLTKDFAPRILHDGYCADRNEYASWLQQGDIVVSTAHHEFQGLALLEAIGLGLMPLAPNRLVYPEYLAAPYLYEPRELAAAMRRVTSSAEPLPPPLLASAKAALTRTASRLGWQQLIAKVIASF